MSPASTRAERLDRAIAVLSRTGTRVRFHRLLSEAAGSHIDRAVYLVLRRLALEGPARVTEVAAQMAVEPSTASRHIRMLEKRGWIVKERDAEDGRVLTASVTPAGRTLVRRIETERRRILEMSLTDWSDDEVGEFIDHLERFVDDLSAALEAIDPWSETA